LRVSFAPFGLRFSQRRTFADSKDPELTKDVLPHVSEDAAKTDKITGESSVEIDQGTPVINVCSSLNLVKTSD
jgi:hypothetical protein